MAGRPRPGSTVTTRDIEFEERASGVPIAVRSPSGYPPPVPSEPEPFTYDPVKAKAEAERLYPESHEAHMRTTKPGKLGTLEDVMRLASVSTPRESGF